MWSILILIYTKESEISMNFVKICGGPVLQLNEWGMILFGTLQTKSVVSWSAIAENLKRSFYQVTRVSNKGTPLLFTTWAILNNEH